MSSSISRISKIIWWGILLLGLIAAGAIILNRQWIVDWWHGMHYTPTAEMLEIRNDLALTGQGEFLFSALQPTLNEADEFNASCHQNASEVAVLGCYTEGVIRVYNIKTPELDGIREVTTAHELLHAVWDRMSAAEQDAMTAMLNEVLAENPDTIGAELETYDPSVKLEEVYVRSGTEVANLPNELENHFSKYFSNRQKIVQFYDNYISVFNAQKEQAEELQSEISKLKTQINAKIKAYEKAAEELQAEVKEFNQCANQVNCFKTQAEFYARRSELVAAQNDLKEQNSTLNQSIANYNAKIDQYNQVVDDSRKLEKEINSNSLTEIDF